VAKTKSFVSLRRRAASPSLGVCSAARVSRYSRAISKDQRFHRRNQPGLPRCLDQPSKKAVASIKGKVRTRTSRTNLHTPPADLVQFLGRMLRGWANYFRRVVAKAIFSVVDSYTWNAARTGGAGKHRIVWPALKRRLCING
jgi:hypothetical protein